VRCRNEPDHRGRAVMKLQMGKGCSGITPCGGCSTIELLPRLMEQVGLEPTTDDNPQLRPIKVLTNDHKAGKARSG
jgi:hypothetical protein